MPEHPEVEIQFDQADFGKGGEKAARTCVSCACELGAQYFVANGQIVCERCARALSAVTSGGTGLGRFAKATSFGIVAGALGAGIYFAIAKLTGYEIGLVAIVVGLLVGGAVRLGAAGRGGALYQVLAVAITYAAIVLTYVPYVLQGLDASAARLPASDESTAVAKVTVKRDQSILLNGNAVTFEALDAELQRVSAAGGEGWYHREDMANAPPGPSAERVAELFDRHGLMRITFTDGEFQNLQSWSEGLARGTPLQKVAVGGFIFALAAASPFLTLPENLIGLLIIGFALFEAWQINKRATLDIKGPFQISELPAQ